MQISKSWDTVTIQKTVKGFMIAGGGAVLAGFVMLVPEVNDFLAKGDPINLSNVLVAAWGALSSGIINAGQQWLKGEVSQDLDVPSN